MRNTRKMMSILAMTAIMVLSVSACGLKNPTEEGASVDGKEDVAEGAAKEGAITLKFAEVNPLDNLDGRIATHFKEEVEKRSDGSIVIDLNCSGVLGVEADVLDGMTSGANTVDLSRISIFALTSYGTKLGVLPSLPFTFQDRDHYWKFTESEIGQRILEEPHELGIGVRGLYFQEEGFRDFFFSMPVDGIDAIKGKKIRVSSDPVMTGMVNGLGASPTVVAYNELYTSLQSGVVDGAENPLTSYASNAFNEVAPYYLLDHHTLSASEVVISEDAWNKLSEEQREILVEAGKDTSAFARELSAKEDEEARKQLEEKGVTFVEVPDSTPYREACADLIKEYTKGIEDEYQQILDCAN